MSVKKFLAARSDPTWNGGQPCRTCKLKNRKSIENACKEFLQARKEGETFMPWRTFVREYLRAEFAYTLGERSLVSHLEKHLGISTK